MYVLDQTWKAFNMKFGTRWKHREITYKEIQISALFYNLYALISVGNCVKNLRVSQNFKQIKFDRVWGKLEAKNCFQRQSFTRHLRQTLVLMWNSALREKFNFYFAGDFC